MSATSPTINLRSARVRGELNLDIRVKPPNEPKIDLRFSEIGQLNATIANYKEAEWHLDGINYRGMDFDKRNDSDSSKMDSKTWLEVLKRQSAIQPYDPFIAYLKMAGLEGQANEACLSKEEHIRKELYKEFKNLSWSKKCSPFTVVLLFRFIAEICVGYGYKWGRGVLSLLLWVAFSSFVFQKAHENGDVFASRAYIYQGVFPLLSKDLSGQQSPNYPEFNPILFSLDTAIPGFDIGQKRHWEIKGETGFEFYLCLHILLGWLFSILVVLSPTKLLHRE